MTDTALLYATQPHLSEWKIAIFRPNTVFSCRVNDAKAARGMRVITYDTAVGSYGLVESGMTAYIGTTLGGKDLGRIRVRSATATTITVAENNDINWANDVYITVVKFFEIWGVYPRLTQKGGKVTFYKDYDIKYTNQNTIMGSFVCAGTHLAGEIDDTGKASFYYSASGTTNLIGDALTYAWTFEGASSGTSTAQTPGWVNYPNPGYFTTKLVVTNASGGTDTTYRHVCVFGKNSNPVREWGIGDMQGTRDAGGYTANVWVRGSGLVIDDNSLVVIYSDDYYGDYHESIDPNKIVFVGYILSSTISYDYEQNKVSFSIGSPSEIMRLQNSFSCALNDSKGKTPKTWVGMKNLNCEKGLYVYLRWQTTILLTSDFRFMPDSRRIKYFDTEKSNLLDSLNGFLANTLNSEIVCTRTGKIYAEINPAAVHDAPTTIPVDLYLDRHNWMGEISIEERLRNEIAYLELGGFKYSESYKSTPLLACSPGKVPAYSGGDRPESGLALTSQSQLLDMVGDIYANLNARYPTLDMEFAGNYLSMDIVPNKQYLITMESTDNPKGISFVRQPFYLSDVGLAYDPVNHYTTMRGSFRPITTGVPGVVLDIPAITVPNNPIPPNPIPNYPPIPNPNPLPLPPNSPPQPPPSGPPPCATDMAAEPSGPFPFLPYCEILDTDELPIRGNNLQCYIRADAAAHQSAYTLNGRWFKWGTTEDDWVEVTSDADVAQSETWYEIYGTTESGYRIIKTTRDAVDNTEYGDSNSRTGRFLPGANALYVDGFEIGMTSTAQARFNGTTGVAMSWCDGTLEGPGNPVILQEDFSWHHNTVSDEIDTTEIISTYQAVDGYYREFCFTPGIVGITGATVIEYTAEVTALYPRSLIKDLNLYWFNSIVPGNSGPIVSQSFETPVVNATIKGEKDYGGHSNLRLRVTTISRGEYAGGWPPYGYVPLGFNVKITMKYKASKKIQLYASWIENICLPGNAYDPYVTQSEDV